jgi:hypothetical protein
MKKTRPTKTRTRRVPRPIIALAAPSVDQPTVTIKMLKGGEIIPELKVPGPTTEKAVARAIAAFEGLIRETHRLEGLKVELKGRLTADLAESVAKAEAAPESGK